MRRGFKAAAAAVAIHVVLASITWGQVAPPPLRDRVLVVSLPDCKLAVLDHGVAVRVFSVTVGAGASPSPAGTFRIVNRIARPTYYHPGIVIPPGPRNPLGTRWLGLDRKGYGIHGTNDPQSVGLAASHGCIRLRNRDVEELFAMVKTGDRVEIHGERDSLTARLFDSVDQQPGTIVAGGQ